MSLTIPAPFDTPWATLSRLTLGMGAALTPDARDRVERRATARAADCRAEKCMVGAGRNPNEEEEGGRRKDGQ